MHYFLSIPISSCFDHLSKHTHSRTRWEHRRIHRDVDGRQILKQTSPTQACRFYGRSARHPDGHSAQSLSAFAVPCSWWFTLLAWIGSFQGFYQYLVCLLKIPFEVPCWSGLKMTMMIMHVMLGPQAHCYLALLIFSSRRSPNNPQKLSIPPRTPSWFMLVKYI